MKKLILIAALSYLGLCPVLATDHPAGNDIQEMCIPQQDKPMKVPEKVRTAFSGAFPDASVTGWRKEGDNYKVMFVDRNMQQVVVYDTNGKVLRKETELDGADVPEAINQYYKKNYPNETNYRIWEVQPHKGQKSYAAPMNDKMLYFDSEGTYTRSEKRSIEDWNKIDPLK